MRTPTYFHSWNRQPSTLSRSTAPSHHHHLLSDHLLPTTVTIHPHLLSDHLLPTTVTIHHHLLSDHLLPTTVTIHHHLLSDHLLPTIITISCYYQTSIKSESETRIPPTPLAGGLISWKGMWPFNSLQLTNHVAPLPRCTKIYLHCITTLLMKTFYFALFSLTPEISHHKIEKDVKNCHLLFFY